ncbi:alpha/beta hydrolase [Kocuria tytonis]|uniref:Alpha/beta fold hydrolase n=1 Tax=Kocuria tytonis TaxID=2054280 RepID=A0A495AB55_9MICC|nr:alpha/beta fold hydrolase [Kocuria tytonis]RKQ37112.1 alpha/beta fold hydrolase [Kocuria tytonis]
MATDQQQHGPLHLPGGSSVGVLVLHGFTSTTASVQDWARAVHTAADDSGAHPGVSVPLLPGHGTQWQDLAAQPWQAWRDAVDEEFWRLRAHHEHVVVCGLSMGGALALHTAARRDVAGVLLVNPALALVNRMARFSHVLSRAVPTLQGIGSDVKRPDALESAYDRTPLAAVAQLNLLMHRTVRMLPAVTAPTVVFRSDEDHVVSGSSADLVARRSSGPVRIVALPDSYHVATLDHDAPVIEGESRDAVARLSRGEAFLPAGPGTPDGAR